MVIDVLSDYWEETYFTATFEFLECEAYSYRSGEDMSMSFHYFTTDLTLYLATDSSKTITWESFTYDNIPCSISEYSITCTGPDTNQYMIISDGTVSDFDTPDSMCSYFNYEDAFTLGEIVIESSLIDDSFYGDYQFSIQGFSSAHPHSISIDFVFTIFADCGKGSNVQSDLMYLINREDAQSYTFIQNTLINSQACP